MKFIVVFVVFIFGYIQINGDGVSQCYFCGLLNLCDSDLPGTIKNCSTGENSMCWTIAISQEDGSYKYAKGCIPNTPDNLEMCASLNQTDDPNNSYYCITCNEDLCNF